MPKPFFVTTPIFYVNAAPHIGHLHSDLVADVLARYHAWRYRGWSPFSLSSSSSSTSLPESVQPIFSTGTDEHGLKIQKVAETSGEDPKALCDRISMRFRDLANAANLSHTHFIRTTEPQHAEAVREIWRRLQEGGYIYKGEHSGWYAVSDEAFYTETQIRERIDPKTGEKHMESIETGQRVEWSSEESYKFRLSLFRDALLTWHTSSRPLPPSFSPSSTTTTTTTTNDRFTTPLQPPSQHDALIAELESGPLPDLSVSRPRSRLHWGIPVPGDEEGHTIYVWIDALVNYLTVTGFPWKTATTSGDGGGGEEGKDEWEGSAWPADVHVVGKDIIRFHAIYWPAMLMAAKLPLPRHIVAHAHWTMNKSKMSKSLGNVVDPFVALQQFRPHPPSSTSPPTTTTTGESSNWGSVDVLRWYLMRIGGNLATDSDYNESILREYHRKNLQSQIGGLTSRALAPKVLQRLTDGQEGRQEEMAEVKVPRPSPVLPEDENLERQIKELAGVFDTYMQRFQLSKALQAVHDAVAEANKLITRLEPWSAHASLSTVQRAVYYSTETLRLAGLLLGATVMPERMAVLLDRLDLQGQQHQQEQEQEQGQEVTTWEGAQTLRDVVSLRFRTDGQKMEPLFPPLPSPPPHASSPGQKEPKKGSKKGRLPTS
ncbi:unnamed protein product [Tilletia controversa]|nr:hypothetical protein CF328_g2255 [Tilletia controversa]CAD6905450.1 unnamed protein product [Tilletia controversa]CAD6977979.1 unnamed protein product [Tilletia controversa]CAD6981473.1 unnamed protein product [Tilletia controversa]